MPAQKTGKYKLLKWIGGILGVIILILAIAAFYISAKWKPVLTEKIKSTVYEGSNHLYRINFTDLHINLLTGTAAMDSVSLSADTAVFNTLRKNGKAPVHLFELKMKQLKLTRIGILTAYFKKRINMNAIILDRPSINMLHFNVPKKTDTVKDDKTLYQMISKSLESIHIRTIKVLYADFDYLSGERRIVLNRVKNLNVNVTDLLIDSASQFDAKRFYYTKDVEFEMSGYKSVTKDKMYTMTMDSLKGSAADGIVNIKNFKMIPNYPDLTFSRKYSHQKDRYDLSFNRISLKGFDFVRFNTEALVYARSAKIGPAKVNVFMNRELPPPTFNKGRNYPQIALQRLEQPLIIDSVKLNNVDVAYTEYNPITKERGTVHIDNLNGNLLNVTNNDDQKAKHGHMLAKLSAVIMNAPINININFNLLAKDGAFHYSGDIGALNMVSLNPLAESLGLVKIESGQVQKADFDVQANLYGSTGSMHLYYTNLKVQLLKEGENGAPMKKRGFLSFLANTFVVKDSNPTKGDPVRTGNIKFERTPAASFFNLLWKGIFIGIRETVGIGAIKPKSPEGAFKKVQAKQADRKADNKKDKDKKSD
ncbi:AsmA family protein [Pedobacter duraquae]|uniref:AsmA-like protein n=1 Tax=Pedobacter duraquae TaxID=425511 RepID=A0A4R6IGP0_9SPHI|nr:hypothetical protein [Pedobacter duraquae]TDO21523.1 hypothetical protein CLV32_2628 [Pedobacter duraquae]